MRPARYLYESYKHPIGWESSRNPNIIINENLKWMAINIKLKLQNQKMKN
jgi:hypothetical protein